MLPKARQNSIVSFITIQRVKKNLVWFDSIRFDSILFGHSYNFYNSCLPKRCQLFVPYFRISANLPYQLSVRCRFFWFLRLWKFPVCLFVYWRLIAPPTAQGHLAGSQQKFITRMNLILQFSQLSSYSCYLRVLGSSFLN